MPLGRTGLSGSLVGSGGRDGTGLVQTPPLFSLISHPFKGMGNWF